MNEKYKKQLDKFVDAIESRKQSEKVLVLAMVVAGLVLTYLSVSFDPLRASVNNLQAQISGTERQIEAQQSAYAGMIQSSQEDPNKFANDRLAVLAREQARLDEEISGLAGDLVSPSEMTNILTSVLARQSGLELVSFSNTAAVPLRQGIVETELAATVGEITTTAPVVSGQVYEHGLSIEFEGDFFNTLKYLRFLENISGSFFWDSISFTIDEWPQADVVLNIHTLSTDRGFIGA